MRASSLSPRRTLAFALSMLPIGISAKKLLRLLENKYCYKMLRDPNSGNKVLENINGRNEDEAKKPKLP